LQEQLRNIMKYAKATSVEVEVAVEDEQLEMLIADNGIGFDVEKAKGGIGLANMRRRTELFSGHIDIESSIGKGCTITVNIPLKDQLH
jgi:signal transduction histidine kinase